VSQADEEHDALAPEDEAALLGALEAALRPEPLDPELNERLLRHALEEPFAPASAEELVESARLRDALEGGTPHEASPLLSALRAPFASVGGDMAGIERALDGALGREPARKRDNVRYARFGVAGAALAAAAAVALFMSQTPRLSPAPAASEAAGFVKPHSTADLFADRFETRATSARMDVIASARGRDLRDNRYAAWGVR